MIDASVVRSFERAEASSFRLETSRSRTSRASFVRDAIAFVSTATPCRIRRVRSRASVTCAFAEATSLVIRSSWVRTWRRYSSWSTRSVMLDAERMTEIASGSSDS